MPNTYSCSDYQRETLCPARFTAETRDELWEHIELHFLIIHHEDPSDWTDLIKSTIESYITQG